MIFILQPALDVAKHGTGVIYDQNLLFILFAKGYQIGFDRLRYLIDIDRTRKFLLNQMKRNVLLNLNNLLRIPCDKDGNIILQRFVFEICKSLMLSGQLFIRKDKDHIHIILYLAEHVWICMNVCHDTF